MLSQPNRTWGCRHSRRSTPTARNAGCAAVRTDHRERPRVRGLSGGMMESVVAMLMIIDAAIGAVWTPDTLVR
jgi:hypothetical protein